MCVCSRVVMVYAEMIFAALRSSLSNRKIFTLLLTSSYHFVANFSDIALIAMQKVW